MLIDFKSLENVSYIIVFLVPGIIISYVRSKFLTGRIPSRTDQVLYYFSITVCYYAVIYPFVHYINWTQQSDYYYGLMWIFFVIVAPLFVGLILGFEVTFDWSRRMLSRLGLDVVHPIPTAWDWVFGSGRRSWIIITLKDDTKFYGYCGENSFISSDPTERDIYIEKIYNYTENGDWEDSGDKGVLIVHGEIRTIELITVT